MSKKLTAKDLLQEVRQIKSGLSKPEPIRYETKSQLESSIDSFLSRVLGDLGFLTSTNIEVKGGKAIVKVSGEVEFDIEKFHRQWWDQPDLMYQFQTRLDMWSLGGKRVHVHRDHKREGVFTARIFDKLITIDFGNNIIETEGYRERIPGAHKDYPLDSWLAARSELEDLIKAVFPWWVRDTVGGGFGSYPGYVKDLGKRIVKELPKGFKLKEDSIIVGPGYDEILEGRVEDRPSSFPEAWEFSLPTKDSLDQIGHGGGKYPGLKQKDWTGDYWEDRDMFVEWIAKEFKKYAK